MAIDVTQRDATKNQSTVDFKRENLFLYGNRFQDAILANKTIAEQVAVTGQLVVRDTATAGQVNLASDANLADVIGITFIGDTTLAPASTANGTDGGKTPVNFAIGGDIDVTLLELPGAATLDTVVGNKALRDILTDLGFVLYNVKQNTKADN